MLRGLALARCQAMRLAAFAQGTIYVVSGLWPVVHLESFEAVTGKKRDRWLVRTTGALIAAVGSALLVGAFERRRSPAIKTLGIASATALGVADLVFVGTGQISRVYLGDAALEAAAIGAWIADREIRTLW
jgi:hypothetical protein